MNTQLIRTQVYLENEDITLLDELARQIRVTRSQIIRDATRAVARQYARFARLAIGKRSTANPLKDLIGFEKSATGTVGLNIDDLYHHD